MPIKIATLNLCLGLIAKKDIIKKLILDERIDILCIQETEITDNLDTRLLSFKGYQFKCEINANRARVGVYINSALKYVRKYDLEGNGAHLVIFDVTDTLQKKNLRVKNLYRSFNPPNQANPRDFYS